MKTTEEIIDACGGPACIAQEVPDRTYSAVHKWLRNGIPPRHWRTVERLSGASLDEIEAAYVQSRSGLQKTRPANAAEREVAGCE